MASYGNTVLTSAGIDLVKRVIAKTATFEITKVATSSDSRLTNATISAIEAMTSLPSVNQTGKVTAFDTSNSKQVGIKCEFTNQGLTNPYNICGVGIYAKEAGKNEILFAVAPAKEPETMPAKPNDQSALFSFSLNMYVVVGQASAMSITATTEGVIKSINGTIKPDANGNVTVSYYSQAEVDQKISSLSSRIDSLNSSKTNNTDFNALKNRVSAAESGKADKTSVYDKSSADARYLQRDASTMLNSGAVIKWADSGHVNNGNNVPYTAGGLKWTGKTDSAEIRAEETGADNLDLVFDLGDDSSNAVDFRWNNVSKAKINSSGKFTGHVDWANVDNKDTYSKAEIDSKVNSAKSEASSTYLPKSGGIMTGNIGFQTKGTRYDDAISVHANDNDYSGIGIGIGAGGSTVIGGGESKTYIENDPSYDAAHERLVLANDADIEFITNAQNGLASATKVKIDSKGKYTGTIDWNNVNNKDAYTKAETDSKVNKVQTDVNTLSSKVSAVESGKTNNTDFNALKSRVSANESGKADKTSVYDKSSADARYLQRDASTMLNSGAVIKWDDSGHANDGNNVPYTAGGLKWTGKTDNVEVRAEETGADNLNLVFDLGDDGSNAVDFRWNNVSKAKVNSAGKFTGHVDWANVDNKDTYSRFEIDSKINTAKSEASARSDQAQNNINALSSKVTNIRVGGRNLLRNSDKLPYSGNVYRPWLTGEWSTAGATTDTEDMKRQNKEIADPPQGDKATVISFTGILRPSVSDISLVAIRNVPVSGNVTVSFWARQTSGVDTAFVSASWGIQKAADVVNTNASTEIWGTTSYPYRKLFLPKDGSWTRFWATFNVNDKGNAYIGAGNTGTSAEVQICLVKIETGTMVTDWTPAPEDLEDSIDTALNTANAAKAKAEANANSIQALSNKVDTKASSADLASLRNRVSDTESGANTLKGSIASANSLASTAVSTSNTNKGNIEALKTKVENQATAISTQGQKISQNSIKITDAANAISSLDSKMARLMPQAAYVPVQVGDKTDLNNMKTCGFYLLQGGTSNSPVDGWTYVTVQGISTRLTQFVWKDLDPYLQWCRWYDGSSWTAWTQYTKAF